MAQKEKPVHRALVGLNWVDGEGTEHRVEAGDKLENLPDNVVKHEKAAGNIEEWEDRHTENVRDLDGEGLLYGVAQDSKGEWFEYAPEPVTEDE